jgi:hypothetical protein
MDKILEHGVNDVVLKNKDFMISPNFADNFKIFFEYENSVFFPSRRALSLTLNKGM